jgi:anaerobic ribonucleoside-triphosphate reductase
MLFSHEMGGFTHGETFSCPNCGKEHSFHQEDIETIRREIEKIENSKLDVEP